MAAKRRLSLRPGTRRGTASHHPNQEMIVTDDEDDLCERIRIRGIDFGNHCPICRRKLVVFDEETDNNSSGSGRVDNKSVKAVTPSNSRLLKSTNHIWKYLHETSRSSNDVNILPDFTFRTMVEVERGTSRITEVPTLCESCFPEILKLNMIHEDLEAVEKVLKLRIRKIRTIIQNSNSIQKVGTKHQNILESTDNCLKVDKFLTYIGAGVVKVNAGERQNSTNAADHVVKSSKSDKTFHYTESYEEDNSNVQIEATSYLLIKEEPQPTNDSILLENVAETAAIVSEDEESANSPFMVDEGNIEQEDSPDWAPNPRKMQKKTPGNTKSHHRNKHQCMDCGATFTRLTSLRRHFLKFHSSRSRPREGGSKENLKCEKCSKLLRSQVYLVFHRKYEDCTAKLEETEKADEQTDGKPVFRCSKCPRSFTNTGLLNAHLKTHKGTKPRSVCDLCGMTFSSTRSLQDHIGRHSNEKPFCCELCGKRFRLAGFLREHKKNGHREIYGTLAKKFKCEVCGKGFYKARHLTDHMLLHTGEMRHQCEFCGKHFRVKRNLKSHINNVHSGNTTKNATSNEECDKIYPCSLCDKTFGSRSSVYGHYRLNHTEWKPFSCDICSIGFKTKYLLRDHNNMVHVTKFPSPDVSQALDVAGSKADLADDNLDQDNNKEDTITPN